MMMYFSPWKSYRLVAILCQDLNWKDEGMRGSLGVGSSLARGGGSRWLGGALGDKVFNLF